MKLLFTLMMLGYAALAVVEPFMVESKVQLDLENSLSRLVPREQFFVQVSTDVTNKSERKLVEGETMLNPTPQVVEPAEPPPIAVMPGFLPDPEAKPQPAKQVQAQPQSREVFQTVDKPVLAGVHVHVTFDDTLDPNVVGQAKGLVQQYLKTNYPTNSSVSFDQISMLKPKKDTVEKKPEPPKEPTLEEKLQKLGPWIFSGTLLLLLVIALLGVILRKPPVPQAQTAGGFPMNFPFFPPMGANGAQESKASNDDNSEAVKAAALAVRRKKLLDKFFLRSDAFRHYYLTLDDGKRNELFGTLRGPAFDSFLRGLEVPVPNVGEEGGGAEPDEIIGFHEKHFDDYSRAKDWQDKQFFGYLGQLSNEQLFSLMKHQNPTSISVMLRFLKASQSAFVLDSLPAEQRVEVLTKAGRMDQLPLQDILKIEDDVRKVVQKLPNHLLGTKQENVNFWGSILGESSNQDTIIQDLEQTNPEIAPDLKKFKFKLEDAASLPEGILDRVFGDADNEELGLALATVAEDVADVLMDSLSQKRKDLIGGNMEVYRSAPAEDKKRARVAITKRFREVMT